jgi:hypothetical protein
VLARRPATEVLLHHHDRRAREPRIVERVRPIRAAVAAGLPLVLEDVLLHSLERHGAQVACRDDPVGVDVVAGSSSARPSTRVTRRITAAPVRR